MVEVLPPGADPDKPVVVVAPSVARAAMESASTYRVGNDTFVVLDLLVGSHLGIRAAIPTLNLAENARLELEGFYGGMISNVGLGSIAGGGLRVQLNVAQDERARNAFFISPGVDFYVAWDETPDTGWLDFGPDSNIYFLAAGADLKWVHEFARHLGLELGLHLGAAVSLGGLDNGGRETRGTVIPEISLFTGLRF
jgi:hypothetical protein